MAQSLVAVLERTAKRLGERLTHLDEVVSDEETADETAWAQYIATASALAHVLDQITPGRRGELLTTAEMARRCGIATKTLLKHKASGKVRPALQRGKLIRWRGDEVTTV